MELLKKTWDMVMHLDSHLVEMVAQYGSWTYVILFAIVFCETGLVITPFLPGDSLLFAAGVVAGAGSLNLWAVIGTLIIAALLGDNVNYWIGRSIGPKVFERDRKWIKRKHLQRTQEFFEKYGGKTVILARFVPIVRTFTPFVAGVGKMPYERFLAFSVGGAILWVCSMTMCGVLFGKIEWVNGHFSIVVLAVIAISLVPAVLEIIRARMAMKSESNAAKPHEVERKVGE